MFVEPGGWGGASSRAGASNVAGVSASCKSTNEEYARELESKLENKEIDANTVVEDPLGVAASVNPGNSRSMASGMVMAD